MYRHGVVLIKHADNFTEPIHILALLVFSCLSHRLFAAQPLFRFADISFVI
jgi:hypothetical protein